jgi:hypothetical protein
MSPLLLRHLWELVATTQSHFLLGLDDNSLVQWLLHQIGSERSLDHHEVHLLSDYIQSRLTLIRDLADDH